MGDGGSRTARWEAVRDGKWRVYQDGVTYNAVGALGSVNVDTAAASTGVVHARVHGCGRFAIGNARLDGCSSDANGKAGFHLENTAQQFDRAGRKHESSTGLTGYREMER